MIPSKPRKSSSRRSSILKPPKPRQPLQNVNLNSSSNENSPATTKLKRRVSFAEKKHVKEFCNSLEQGTVWDNTYEEHDLSSAKASCQSDEGDGSINDVLKENIQVDELQGKPYIIASNDDSIASFNKEENVEQLCVPDGMVQESLNTTDCDLNFTNPVESIQPDQPLEVQEEIPSNTQFVTLQNEVIRNESHSSSKLSFNFYISKSPIPVYTDIDENMPNAIENPVSQSSLENINSPNLDKTCIEDVAMEFTTAICNTLHPNNICEVQDKEDTGVQNTDVANIQEQAVPASVFQNMSMEITQAVPTVLPILKPQLQQSVHCLDTDDKTQYFHDASMEYTVGLQCLKNHVAGDLRESTRNIERFNPQRAVNLNVEDNEFISPRENIDKVDLDVSMEFTMAISSVLKPAVNAVHSNINEPSIEDERTKVFQDTPMELTAAIPLPRIQQFNDKTVINTDYLMEQSEKMKNTPLAQHENNSDILKSDVGRMQNRKEAIDKEEKTRFLNVSMEITKAVNVHTMEYNKELSAVDSEIVHNFIEKNTETVNNDVMDVDETKTYDDEPMEFTTAITAFPRAQSHIPQNNPTLQRGSLSQSNMHNFDLNPGTNDRTNKSAVTFEDRTTIFQDKSLTMTAAIPSLHLNNHMETKRPISDLNVNHERVCDKTVLYPNMSMEVTNAISSLIHRPKLNGDTTGNLNNTASLAILEDPEKENIPNVGRTKQMELSKSRTIASNEVSMEITAAVSRPLVNVHSELDKENRPIERSLRSNDGMSVTKVTVNETPSITKNSMALHKPVDQFQSFSASAENNSPLTTTHVTKADHFSVASSLHHSKNAEIYSQAENIASDRGKASTEQLTTQASVQKLISSVSMTQDNLLIANEENTEIVTTKNNDATLFFKASDKQSRAHSTLKYFDISQDVKNPDEKGVTFFDESLEDIEAINPPSFLCENDSVCGNTSENNISPNQEKEHEHAEEINQDSIKSRQSIISKSVENIGSENTLNFKYNYKDYNLVRDHGINPSIEDVTRKSQTFVMRLENRDTDVNNSKLDDEIQIEVNEVQMLQFTYMNNTIAENEDLQRTSSLLNEICDVVPMFDVKDSQVHEIGEQNSQIACANTINVENQVAEYSSASINNSCKEIRLSDIELIDVEETGVETMTECIEKNDSNNEVQSHIVQDESNNISVSTENLQDVEMSMSESICNLESHEDMKEKDISIELDAFSALVKKLRIHALSDDIIWEVCHENIERNMIVIGFISSSLLLVIYFTENFDDTFNCSIKEIKIISRLADDAGTLVSIAHRILLEKLDTKTLMCSFKSYKDVLPMLDHISTEVKLSLDFMFDLRRLDDMNLMNITPDRISFISRTKRMDIILKVTVNVKPLNKIQPNDVTVKCLLGSISDENVKQLIANVKRDHKFLRRYMSDVRDYIYLMEETSFTIKKS